VAIIKQENSDDNQGHQGKKAGKQKATTYQPSESTRKGRRGKDHLLAATGS